MRARLPLPVRVLLRRIPPERREEVAGDLDEMHGRRRASRGMARSRELSVRSALGASRGRLVGLLLAESFVLSTVAAGLGLALAVLIMGLIVDFTPVDVPRLQEVGLNPAVVLITLAIGVLSAPLVGWLPVLASVRSAMR